MKIMRRYSWSKGWAACAGAATMRHGIADPRRCRPAPVATERRLHMQWQTPTATDFRFGFEITLYVAAR
jgi:coenzyme PQQ precursor peptide PqqA